MLRILLFKNRINKLPKELQKKIYIHCFKKLWREYIPLTAKIPSWYKRKIDLDRYYFENMTENIHFLHYDFNCLPENKQWIMGCQCDFCVNYVDENHNITRFLEHLQSDDPYYFESTVPLETCSQWNEKYKYNKYGEKMIANFDPLYGSIFK